LEIDRLFIFKNFLFIAVWMYLHEEWTHKIIAAAIEVHKNLGPGLLEAVYLDCLGFEFENHGLQFQQELNIPVS